MFGNPATPESLFGWRPIFGTSLRIKFFFHTSEKEELVGDCTTAQQTRGYHLRFQTEGTGNLKAGDVMNQDRKQELDRLLQDAMANLEIRHRSDSSPHVVDLYSRHLRQRWTSSADPRILLDFKPHIASEAAKSNLLNFIREELSEFIHEDRIESVSLFITGGGFGGGGYPLDFLLEQLLKIAIVRGVEEAISAFDRAAKGKHVPFQFIALLEGIRLEAELEVFEGIRLVPLPGSTSQLPSYLQDSLFSHLPASFFLLKTLLVVDAAASPVFLKPFLHPFLQKNQKPPPLSDLLPQLGINFKSSSIFKSFSICEGVEEFRKTFCHALSIACNSAVRITYECRLLAEAELCNLNTIGISGVSFPSLIDLSGSATEAGEPEISEAKRLYNILVNLDLGTRNKLQIPIERWIKSKTTQSLEDKMIDLGIAFESIYLSDINERTELSFRVRLHAAWYLAKNKKERQEFLDEFKEIYTLRSKAVHDGKLSSKVKMKGKSVPTPEFIERAQALCQQSIIKIMEEGRFPNWNDLILG